MTSSQKFYLSGGRSPLTHQVSQARLGFFLLLSVSFVASLSRHSAVINSPNMSYNRAENVNGFAYHYFTIRPGLFEAQVFVSVKIRSGLFYFSLAFGKLSS